MAVCARTSVETAMRIAAVCFALLLTACAGVPPPPDWQANAHAALAAYSSAYLAGRERIARQELTLARREVARTGDASQIARVELTACALALASLDFQPCTAFDALAQDADGAARAYADYLAGRWEELDPRLLPPPHQAVPGSRDVLATLAAIDDPRARLIAAAALLRIGRLPPQGIALAIETASRQGWRRPLLAWLAFDRERCRAAGDETCRHARERQIGYVLGGAEQGR